MSLKIVTIDTKYCDYLRRFDFRVPYNMNEKEKRPFIGVLFEIKNLKYFAPMSSPKKKHLTMKNTLDFFKIDSGKLGAINFNNMIPVIDGVYEFIDLYGLDGNNNEKYLNLLNNQLYNIRRKENVILNKALNLYNNYLYGKLPENIRNRCVDFIILEQHSKEYKN